MHEEARRSITCCVYVDENDDDDRDDNNDVGVLLLVLVVVMMLVMVGVGSIGPLLITTNVPLNATSAPTVLDPDISGFKYKRMVTAANMPGIEQFWEGESQYSVLALWWRERQFINPTLCHPPWSNQEILDTGGNMIPHASIMASSRSSPDSHPSLA
ncbi:hypothetical protein PoB_007192800 [Plakobranchus ocellatus]|uniref:Uncharacterized protein n=1 Tax=Plakobranchus ocellatus TaxID=259542 RepID=A0AAV4DM78_9GAST|nr:hypothetical protein PoB_007192800 [Plakobranchus ocellatus]